MPRKEIGLKILAAICFVVVIMGLGSALTASGLASWYQTLLLPSYTPSGSVIGIVWTLLYALLAASMVLSWQSLGSKAFWRSVGPLYVLNGVVNVLWSYVFFSMHDISGAAVTAGTLVFTVLVLIFANLKASKLAAALLIPYLLWTSFATVLNVHIMYLNAPDAATGTPTLPMPEDREDEGGPLTMTFTITTGSTKNVDSHLALTLNGVNDSRCPTDEGVYCIWAGELAPDLTAALDGKTSQVRLGTTTAREADVGSYHLTLLDAGLESAKIRVDLP